MHFVMPSKFSILAVIIVALSFSMGGCTYLSNALKQAHYSVQQKNSPKQRVYKHMLEAENFFVFGKIGNNNKLNKDAVAVVAVSTKDQSGEIVDVSHSTGVDSYFGLNLPEGDYNLLVVSDLNRDGVYDGTEVAGGRSLSLNRNDIPEKVLGDYDIDMGVPFSQVSANTFLVKVRKSNAAVESLYYPKGSIRTLDDEIFSQRMTSLGMYEPASFLEEAPMMFYALEEDLGYKVPVVFVHGIGGSARDFEEIIDQMDRTRYKPWFFYYPSGNDLSQLSEMFYKIFLSGKVIALGEDSPIVIVAHSMGGLVARDALNRCTGKSGENKVKCLITIASPLAGHPLAASASKGLIVLPSWRDMTPGSKFMQNLRRKKLPDGLSYHLIYAYGNTSAIKLGENSDGVVPLSSQLSTETQNEATTQYGFNDTHTGILKNPEAIQRIFKTIGEVKSPFPEDHMKEFLKGGYSIDLGDEYPPYIKYTIRTVGHWVDALVAGTIAPVHPIQTHFVQVCRGEKSPNSDFEREWLRFIKQYPDRGALK
jgi:triacylglycerol esterase/lipase EstA (alpha/beta hydrolase family)